MHIAFKIGLDKIDSFSYANIRSEKIDFFLNRGLEIFIKQRAFGNNRTGKGFEQSQKRIDDIKRLVKDEPILAYTTSDPKVFKATLPDDYNYLVASTSKVYGSLCQDPIIWECNSAIISDAESAKTEFDIYGDLVGNFTSVGMSFDITYNGTSIFGTPLILYGNASAIVNLMKTHLLILGSGWSINQGSIEDAVIKAPPGASYNGANVVYSYSGTIMNSSTFELTEVNESETLVLAGGVDATSACNPVPGLTDTKGQYFTVLNRQVQHDDINLLLKDPHNRPHIRKPLILFKGGDLYIYTDGTFIVNTVNLSYIRKHVKMSFTDNGGIGTDCELDDHTHQEIVDIAVALASSAIETPSAQNKFGELNIHE